MTQQVRSKQDTEEYPFECSNPAGCKYHCHVALAHWVCGSCDPYHKIQTELERAAIKFSYLPDALPLPLQRRFRWYTYDSARSDESEWWPRPLDTVPLAELKKALAEWTETVSCNEQLICWCDRNQPDRHSRALMQEIAELEPALVELKAELERREHGLPFAGSVTFDKSTYREDMEPGYYRNKRMWY
jgi:hypothetical protein